VAHCWELNLHISEAKKTILCLAEWFGNQDKSGSMYHSWTKNPGANHQVQGKPVIGICNT
jgi:hypothetical protein